MGKILVTGGGSGIGAAIARRFADLGHHVVVADFNTETGSQVAFEVKGEFDPIDVTDEAAWSQLAQRHFDVDIVFLNAGTTTLPKGDILSDEPTTPAIPLTNVSLADYRRVSAVNIDGVVLGTMAFFPVMAARGAGQIVATASVAGLVPFPQEPIYALTKHAVVGFVRSMGAAAEPYGVRINAICPGFVQTNLLTEETLGLIRAFGLPVIDAGRVADAAQQVVESATNGALWFVNGEKPIGVHSPNDPDLV
jgi:NAD(P)-dependent dehydrogenase (short-subunit alcohol dehydrogenase family)